MALFIVFFFIGYILSFYFLSWEVFNKVLIFSLIFAAITLGLKFVSLAGLNSIVVFFTYLALF